MDMKVKGLVVVAMLLLGAILICNGLFTPYPIRDMNNDGRIDWKDFDVNEDNVVDMKDIQTVARAYGKMVGDEGYSSRVDFNGDGVIDDYDLNAIRSYFGQGLNIIDLFTYRALTLKGMQVLAGIASTVAAAIVWFKWKVKR